MRATTTHNVALYASLIETCSSTKNLTKLKQIHARVLSLGVSHHDFIRAKLVSSYAACSQIREASFIFSTTNRCSTFLYNCLIRANASLDLHSKSLQIFKEMLLSNKLPDRHTLPSVLKSCSALPSLHLGRQVHAYITLHGPYFSSDITISNALITMYSKCGDVGTARRVFDEMPERNLVTWTAMMCGYAMHGVVGEVLRLFEDMLVVGREKPDGMVFTAVLMACSHGGLVEMGRGFFEMMKEERFGVKPTVEHYTCLVDMLGRAGRVEEVEKVVAEMEVEGDEGLWRALLGACRDQGKMEVAERVAERVYGRQSNSNCNLIE